MGINMDWGKILSTLVAELVKLLLPKAKDLLEWAIDWGYKAAEEWSKKLEKKPESAEKMAVAVGVVTSLVPDVEPAAARMLLEAKHLAQKQ